MTIFLIQLGAITYGPFRCESHHMIRRSYGQIDHHPNTRFKLSKLSPYGLEASHEEPAVGQFEHRV